MKVARGVRSWVRISIPLVKSIFKYARKITPIGYDMFYGSYFRIIFCCNYHLLANLSTYLLSVTYTYLLTSTLLVQYCTYTLQCFYTYCVKLFILQRVFILLLHSWKTSCTKIVAYYFIPGTSSSRRINNWSFHV